MVLSLITVGVKESKWGAGGLVCALVWGGGVGRIAICIQMGTSSDRPDTLRGLSAPAAEQGWKAWFGKQFACCWKCSSRLLHPSEDIPER